MEKFYPETFHGQIDFYAYVSVPLANGQHRHKRVKLHTAFTEYAERSEVVRQFKESNTQFKEVYAHFIFTCHVD